MYVMKMAANCVPCFKNTCGPSEQMIHDIHALKWIKLSCGLETCKPSIVSSNYCIIQIQLSLITRCKGEKHLNSVSLSTTLGCEEIMTNGIGWPIAVLELSCRKLYHVTS